jgi:hypothetical protein
LKTSTLDEARSRIRWRGRGRRKVKGGVSG